MRLRSRSTSSSRAMVFRAALGTLAAACAAAPSRGRADDTAAAAQVLFDEAMALKAKEDWAAACPKFESSYKLDPALGTLLNLANCFEKLGQIASAWARFEEAYQWAVKNGDDRAEFAKTQRDALAPRLPKLTIKVTSRAAALSIERDRTKLSEAMYGTALPVDPGEHTVFIKRDDEVLRTEKIKLAEAQSGELSFDLAAIEKAAPPPKPKGNVVIVGTSPALRKVGWGVGAAGVAGLLAATGLVGAAYSKKGEADRECVDKFCTPLGKKIADEAVGFADAAQWVGIGSLAVVAVGVTLLIVAPSRVGPVEQPASSPRADHRERRDVWAAPWIAPGGAASAGLGMGGGLVIGGDL